MTDSEVEASGSDTLTVRDLRRRFENGGGGGGASGSTRTGTVPSTSRAPSPVPGVNGNADAGPARPTALPPPEPTRVSPVENGNNPNYQGGKSSNGVVFRPLQQLQQPALRPPATPTKPQSFPFLRPQPPPDHPDRTSGTQSLPERKKPPLAPKPKHLLADYKPAPIVPERQESLAKETSLESVRAVAKRIQEQLYAQKRMSGVRIVIENGGSVPGTPIHLSPPFLPTMKEEEGEKEEEREEERESRVEIEVSNGGGDSDDAYADSEIDSEESRSTADTTSQLGTFGRTSNRYASSTSGYGSSDIHSAIMRELHSKGVTPSSSSTIPSIPPSLGQMRSASTRQEVRSVSGSALSGVSPRAGSDVQSAASSSFHSFGDSTSGVSAASVGATSAASTLLQEAAEVPDYSTGDEKEDQRLKRLHYAALEFLTVQRVFVEYLNMIINIYPSYLSQYGEQVGRPILSNGGASTVHHHEGFHVVQRVQKLLIPYHEFHKILLKDIGEMMENWTSTNPRMSQIFLRTAPFLKQCVPFLKEKSKIADEMTRLIKEDADFAAATLSFEQRVFNRGVGAVIQQLDQVHQNFMRYKLLMLSYSKFLPEGSEEWEQTNKVIGILEGINMEVNQSMGLPNSDQLMRLHTMYQGQFDVFKQGRRLIRQENVDKQTRKETQPRTLVLFSDMLWLCRVMTSLGSAGMFDMTKSYAIPIDEVRLEITNHFDYDCYMEIRSKRKSAGIWFKCASARDEWKVLIEKAKGEKLALKERLHTARKRSTRTGPSTPTTPAAAAAGTRESVLSRAGSGLSVAAAAAAALPVRQAPPPPPLVRPHSIVVKEGGRGSVRRKSEDTEGDDTEDYARSHEEEEEEEEEELVTPVGGHDDSDIIEQTRGGDRNGNGYHHQQQPSSSHTVTGTGSMEIGEQPVWINDQMSTKCLMEGCENDFNLFQRRHHCRNCGWLICKKCRGYAPVQRLRFEREIVCPECYDDIEAQYVAGTLFPPSLLVEVDRGVYWLAVTKGKKGKERIERVNPAALFSPPHHRGYKRMQNIDQRMRQGDSVYSRVYLKTKRGEVEMHAQLADEGLRLVFYKAAFDKHPHEQHIIYGFSLTIEDAVTESGRVLSGKRFILRHVNQHGAENQRVISFRVPSDTAAKKWTAELKKALKDECLDDDDE